MSVTERAAEQLANLSLNLPLPDDKVDLHVRGKTFRLTAAALYEESSYFKKLITMAARGGHSNLENNTEAEYIIEANADVFEHIIDYCSSKTYPLFYSNGKQDPMILGPTSGSVLKCYHSRSLRLHLVRSSAVYGSGLQGLKASRLDRMQGLRARCNDEDPHGHMSNRRAMEARYIVVLVGAQNLVS